MTIANAQELVIEAQRIQRHTNGIFSHDAFMHAWQAALRYLTSSSLTIDQFAEQASNVTPEALDRIKFIAEKLKPIDGTVGTVKIYPGGRKILTKNLGELVSENFFCSEKYYTPFPNFSYNLYNDGQSLLLEDILLASGVIYPIGNPLTTHLFVENADLFHVSLLQEAVLRNHAYCSLSASQFWNRYMQYLTRIFLGYTKHTSVTPELLFRHITELKEQVTMLEARPMELSEFVNEYGW